MDDETAAALGRFVRERAAQGEPSAQTEILEFHRRSVGRRGQGRHRRQRVHYLPMTRRELVP